MSLRREFLDNGAILVYASTEDEALEVMRMAPREGFAADPWVWRDPVTGEWVATLYDQGARRGTGGGDVSAPTGKGVIETMQELTYGVQDWIFGSIEESRRAATAQPVAQLPNLDKDGMLAYFGITGAGGVGGGAASSQPGLSRAAWIVGAVVFAAALAALYYASKRG